jgi:hypothetical protein
MILDEALLIRLFIALIVVAAGYKVGRISAKESHLGAPRSLMEVMKKHYYYGTTLPEFLEKNPKKGIKQLSPLRPAYAKNWKLFFRHPIMTVDLRYV